jgi:hypothetical protein
MMIHQDSPLECLGFLWFSSVPNAFQEARDLKGTHGGHHGWHHGTFRASGVASPVAPRHWSGIRANHPAKCLSGGTWKMMESGKSGWNMASEDGSGEIL